jgi:hypothetical protein
MCAILPLNYFWNLMEACQCFCKLAKKHFCMWEEIERLLPDIFLVKVLLTLAFGWSKNKYIRRQINKWKARVKLNCLHYKICNSGNKMLICAKLVWVLWKQFSSKASPCQAWCFRPVIPALGSLR